MRETNDFSVHRPEDEEGLEALAKPDIEAGCKLGIRYVPSHTVTMAYGQDCNYSPPRRT